MADFTHKNLGDVEDKAPSFGFGERQSARFAGSALDAVDTGVSLMEVKAGQRQGFAHRHDAAEEVYVVLRGSGRIKLDEEIVEVRELDAVRIAPGVARSLEGGPEGLQYLAFGPHHEGDGDLIHDENFWG